jgi:hypothetical protein
MYQRSLCGQEIKVRGGANQYFSTVVSLFILLSASKFSQHDLNDNQIIKERMAAGLIATSNVNATPFCSERF